VEFHIGYPTRVRSSREVRTSYGLDCLAVRAENLTSKIHKLTIPRIMLKQAQVIRQLEQIVNENAVFLNFIKRD
jgi:hypothetical protein